MRNTYICQKQCNNQNINICNRKFNQININERKLNEIIRYMEMYMS